MNKIVFNDFAPLADKYATIPAEGSSGYQQSTNLLDEDSRNVLNYATFEEQGINLLDNTLYFAEESDNLGYISSAVSLNSRQFSPSVDIVIDLGESFYSAPGITLHFWQNYCTEFSVRWYQNDIRLQWVTFRPSFSEEDKKQKILSFYGEQAVENFNKIIISFDKSEVPNQFVKLAGIDLGRTWDITDFHSNITIFTEIDPDSADVPGSTCDFIAEITGFEPQNMQELYAYGGKDEQLFGKFIVERAPSIGKNLYSFECSDEIMKMDNPQYPQKSQSTWTANEVASEIKTASNVDIDCGAYNSTELNGFFEKDKSVRHAVAMLSFGLGCFVSGFRSKKLSLRKPKNRRNKRISSSSILGKAEYTQNAPYTELVIHEYSESFDTIVNTRGETNSIKRATDATNPLLFNQYSIMSDIDNRFAEIKEAGYFRNEINARIEYTDEAPGDILSIETAYNGWKTGIVKSMELSIGHKITATLTIVERDYAANGGEE